MLTWYVILGVKCETNRQPFQWQGKNTVYNSSQKSELFMGQDFRVCGGINGREFAVVRLETLNAGQHQAQGDKKREDCLWRRSGCLSFSSRCSFR